MGYTMGVGTYMWHFTIHPTVLAAGCGTDVRLVARLILPDIFAGTVITSFLTIDPGLCAVTLTLKFNSITGHHRFDVLARTVIACHLTP